MCGIVGAISDRNVLPMLLAGLARLEYRGYDSSGVALASGAAAFERIRVAGRVADLSALAAGHSGTRGIAHTRWATHGVPSERNAHPHLGGDSIMVVHNGIIENHQSLRAALTTRGYVFTSDTDTEVIAHLIHAELQTQGDLLRAVQAALPQLHGAYAIGVLAQGDDERLICARRGSPLVLGLGFGEQYFASDIAALLPLTQRVIYLEEGELADVRRDAIQLYDAAGQPTERAARTIDVQPDAAELGQYRHYMQKEIFEQPTALASTLARALELGCVPATFGPTAEAVFQAAPAVRIVACGSSYHAGLVARYWIEEWTGLPVSVEIASEYRYRSSVEQDGTLVVAISQSGETADLLAAARSARERGKVQLLALCNVPHSTLTREADLLFLTQAGLEIGVASTKAFTTQLAALFVLGVALAGARQSLPAPRLAELIDWLPRLPALARDVLALEPQLEAWAHELSHDHNALFLGRHTLFPIALEGALKLKEIAYIHAEGYAGGELKHGPLALVDETMPVIVCAGADAVPDKLASNLREVMARGGRVYLLAEPGCEALADGTHRTVLLPQAAGPLAALTMTLPLQLLAYHTACRKGTDVDKPRNLAKSVTVE
ncbi:glucosamine--fructose-6-phosphate aminotransferase (isomerizing) [Andreprevotia lacus DSM 23236]|jgi:glucosamine--fructose-6-phosphate aminotransferase (isomerizing)|uniref:Glutamine--fructose-6-phosphate aminotransferase [isomerizing] n=1 Tax=Andreprevotia lacus DSM 23236 TaxID=1121001 RepID=A0A1W1X2N3_9NEIS|nr:glutamine--fructose-6-phosphate transaminase (isomerizing) [Andreprevotia lacus]SMC18165.1 glucosamine--fructose-6-phosphate aminotransferase (isomerizing) [Andreprevotia lacus DSM 23236]